MNPFAFLFLMIGLTAAAAAAQVAVRSRHRRALRALAGEWQMHYAAADRFRIAPRIASRLPVPGAAAVRVSDVIYGIEADQYRYLFLASYTAGTVSVQTRRRTVITFCEPRDRAADPATLDLHFAPDGAPVIEQYRQLRKLTCR